MPRSLQLNMSARDAGRRDELLKQAKRRAENTLCFYPGCQEKAIGSHVMQERGILDQIADNGKIIEFAQMSHFQPPRFESAGIGATNRLRFYGFCKKGPDHDRAVFNPIENNICDFSSYKEQLLSSYRALCNGYYQAKLANIYHELVYNDPLI